MAKKRGYSFIFTSLAVFVRGSLALIGCCRLGWSLCLFDKFARRCNFDWPANFEFIAQAVAKPLKARKIKILKLWLTQRPVSDLSSAHSSLISVVFPRLDFVTKMQH